MRRVSLSFLLPAAVASLVACRSEAPAPRSLVVTHDLVALARSADASGPWDHVVFGTPGASRFQIDGFATPVEPERAEPFLWGRQSVELRVGGAPGDARRVVLDLAPHPRTRKLRFDVYFNGRRRPTVFVEPTRARYVLDLPATPTAAAADNVLRLFFRGVSRHTRDYGGRVAAAFYTLTAGPAGDPGLAALAAGGAPPLEVHGDGIPALVQGTGALRYVLRLGAGSELRFTPAPAKGAPATLRVTLAGATAERELWKGAVPGDGREVRVALPGSGIAALTLHVDAASGARVRWTAPRVMGARADVLFPGAGDDPAPTTTLRTALSGMNVLLVILDAASARHFSTYGYSRATTPAVDRLASEGVVFERAYTPAVYTLPAMSSAFTGLEPDEHGSVDLHLGRFPGVPSLAEVLSARGIHTAGFVANGVVGRMRGFHRGFAEFFEMYRSATDPTQAGSFREVLHPWLEANRARRFFAWVHVREPHFPYDPPAPFDTAFGPDGPIPKALRSEIEFIQALDHRRRPAMPEEIEHLNRLYDGNLAYADAELAALRAKLEETGLLEKTVVIVAADHGEGIWDHGHIGHEVLTYEEETRIPLIVRFPKGHGPAGVRVRELVSLTDLAPTIADAFGLWADPASRPRFRSRSLLPVAVGGPGRRAVVSRDRGMEPRYAIREGDAKAIVTTSTGGVELYDLARDPGETRDLSQAEPMRAAFYRQALAAWVMARVPEGVVAPKALTPEQQENMRALGYIQ